MAGNNKGWRGSQAEKMEGWMDREKRHDGGIKDSHSKANSTRERDYSGEETVSLKRARRTENTERGLPYRLC